MTVNIDRGGGRHNERGSRPVAQKGEKGRQEPSSGQDERRQSKLKAAKEQSKLMRRVVRDLEARVKREHTEHPPDRSGVEQSIAAQQERIEAVRSKIRAAKDQAKRRKREIDEWKDWYARIPEIDKQEEWEKVRSEATWRGTEIGELEGRISALEGEKMAAITELEIAQEQLEALNAGVYRGPWKHDPRIAAARAELEEAKQAEEKAKGAGGKPEKEKKPAKRKPERAGKKAERKREETQKPEAERRSARKKRGKRGDD